MPAKRVSSGGPEGNMYCRTYTCAIRRLPALFIVVPYFVEVIFVELAHETGKVAVLEMLRENVLGEFLVLRAAVSNERPRAVSAVQRRHTSSTTKLSPSFPQRTTLSSWGFSSILRNGSLADCRRCAVALALTCTACEPAKTSALAANERWVPGGGGTHKVAGVVGGTVHGAVRRAGAPQANERDSRRRRKDVHRVRLGTVAGQWLAPTGHRAEEVVGGGGRTAAMQVQSAGGGGRRAATRARVQCLRSLSPAFPARAGGVDRNAGGYSSGRVMQRRRESRSQVVSHRLAQGRGRYYLSGRRLNERGEARGHAGAGGGRIVK